MTNWWEIGAPDKNKLRGVAYYRHSSQDQNSIPIQQEQVREWAGEVFGRQCAERIQPRPGGPVRRSGNDE